MTKKSLHILACCLLSTGIFTSCWQDRSGEYYALINSQKWIYETMLQDYLFYEDLETKEEQDINFFEKPQQFLSSIISSKDQKNGVNFSHVDSVEITQATRALVRPSFGMEGAFIRIPDGSEGIRIIYTEKDSPAEEAKLKRGDWIIAANGQKINSTDYKKYILEPTKAYKFTIGALNGEKFDTLGVVQMPDPRPVKTNHIFDTHIVNSGSRKAFYMLYNEFGNDEEQLKALFAQLAGQQVDDIILDLRYNGGGYVATSQLLSTNLAPQEALNQPFLKMTFNDKINKTDIYTLDANLLSNATPISYENLYIITSENTASASEILINGLRPYMKGRIFQVGTATFGKNLAQHPYRNETAPGIELWLTTCSLSNSEDFGDYFKEGLPADFTIQENLAGPLGDFGTPEDSLMTPILYRMENGTFPVDNPKPQYSRATAGVQITFNPIDHRPKVGKLPWRD